MLWSIRVSRVRVGVPPTRFFGGTPKTTPETGMLPGTPWLARPFLMSLPWDADRHGSVFIRVNPWFYLPF